MKRYFNLILLIALSVPSIVLSDINALDKQKILSIIQDAKRGKTSKYTTGISNNSVLALGTISGEDPFVKHLNREYPNAKLIKSNKLVYPVGTLPMLPPSEKMILPQEKNRYSELFGDKPVKTKGYNNKRGNEFKSGRSAHIASSSQPTIVKKFY